MTSSSPAGQYPFSLNAGSLTATNYAFVLASPTATDQLIVHPTVTDVRVLWGTQSMSILGLTRDLPFSTITGIEVIYSDNVQLPTVSALNLTSSSGTAAPPEPTSVAFASKTASNAVTWTLPSALGVDMLTATLNESTISSLVNGVAIGLYGTNAFNFDVLPGDFNGDRSVTSADPSGITAARATTNIWADVDGSGVVDVTDVALAQSRRAA